MSERSPIAESAAHDGDCCPCVERLRAQNKASSDEWTKRTAKMQSDLDGLRHLMRTAATMNHERRHANGLVTGGLSAYGNACIAVALDEADNAIAEAHALREEMHSERRARIAVEARLAAEFRRQAARSDGYPASSEQRQEHSDSQQHPPQTP